LLQAAAPREVPRAPRPVLEGHQGGRRFQEVARPRPGRAVARSDRGDRQDLLGDQAGVGQPPLTGGRTAISSFGPTGVFSPSVGSLPFTHTRLISSTAPNSAP